MTASLFADGSHFLNGNVSEGGDHYSPCPSICVPPVQKGENEQLFVQSPHHMHASDPFSLMKNDGRDTWLLSCSHPLC